MFIHPDVMADSICFLRKELAKVPALITEGSYNIAEEMVVKVIFGMSLVENILDDAQPLVPVTEVDTRPTCPDCNAVMVKTRIELEDKSGWMTAWSCECEYGAGDPHG